MCTGFAVLPRHSGNIHKFLINRKIMPYQIMKYENISELKRTPRVSSTAILFGSLSGGLTLLCTL
jgi:hypothetical protein